MAAVSLTAISTDIAESLTMEEIPIKLRCAACNKLAVNAFRLPCCEQSICENCMAILVSLGEDTTLETHETNPVKGQASLPEACPVCAHEPVKADLCKPNKALRTTIKVFLRTEEKKRETLRGKDQIDLAPQTPVTPATAVEVPGADGAPAVGVAKAGDSENIGSEKPTKTDHADVESAANIGVPGTADAQMDIPRPSVEVTSQDQQFDHSKESVTGLDIQTGMIETDRSDMNFEPKPVGGEDQRLLAPGQHGESGQWGPVQGAVQGQMFPGTLGFAATANGLQNMGGYAQGDFNQLMQFMPNGMPNNGMGGFPSVMGMSGMGMDPMAMSQGMYGGFGGQGMGMNGMNMGMGFGAGQGAYGGFNGQATTWNGGQDKFNPNAFGSLTNGMGGDFGANAGYGGYNMPQHQGNYGQMHQQQYPHNNFQNGFTGQGYNQSGRGRGRGYGYTGRGRGGYGPAIQGNQGKQEKNYEPFHHQVPSQLLPQNLPDQEPSVPRNISGGDADEVENKEAESAPTDHELNPGGEGDDAEVSTTKATEPALPDGDVTVQTASSHATTEIPVLSSNGGVTQLADDVRPAPIETMVSEDRPEQQAVPTQLDEETAISPMTLMPPPNAPTAPLGPAALYRGDSSQDFAGRGRGGGRGYYRGGAELRGGFRGRGTGFAANGIGAPSSLNGHSIPTTDFPGVVPVEPKGLGVEGAPKAPKALREGLPNTGIRGGRGFSIVGRASVAAQGRPNGSRRSRSASPSRRRSQSRSRSPSRHRSRHHRRHRHRSPSTSSYDSERERRRERKQRRSSKYADDGMTAREEKEGRSRATSVESLSKRSSQRGHRDKDNERRSSHKHRTSHRSHRDRSRSRSRSRDHRHRRKRSRSRSVAVEEMPQANRPNDPAQPTSPSSNRRKEKDKERDYHSSKHRDRDRDRDRVRDESYRERKRSRRDRSASPNDQESEYSYLDRSSRRSRNDRDHDDRDKEPSTKPHHDDKNTNNRDKTTLKPGPAPSRPAQQSIPTGPKKLQPQRQPQTRQDPLTREKDREQEKDPHTLEREARNRERLLKEQQRREAVLAETSRTGTGGGGKRRERDGPSSRRMSYKYEDEESGEARARRVEVERESARWG